MADKTLTVNGQPFTINRDRKAEVTQLTVNGQAFHINRTADVIESDPVGNSRPLLDKLVGGAAAAYSLRDLNSKQGDTDVVNVRRSGDSLEKVFQAKDVHKIEDWVKGKQETTLPADVASASAAYSLRKVKADYSGNAVRIRRSSDEIEVDVAFDSNDKISASSAITNVSEQGGESGNTTATTLGEFINHSGDFEDFRVDDEWSDNLLSFSSVGKTSFSVEAKSLSGFNSTDTVRVSAPITKVISEPQASITKFKTTFTIDSISGEGNGNATDGALYVKGANSPNGNGSWNLHNSPDGTGGDETFKFTSAGTYTVEGYGEDATDAYNLAFRTFSFIIYSGTKVSVSNVSMEVLNDCSVHTWYDQAGAKDATKITATNQPKIAENGALLTGGIKFNGSTTSLSTGTQVFTANETGSQSLYAVCNVTDGASGYIAGSADDDSSGHKRGQSIYYYTTTDMFVLSNGNVATNNTVDRISSIDGSNILVSFNYNNNTANTLNQNANQNGYSDGTDAYNFEAGSNFIIGARGGTVQAGRALNGSIQEVIAYNTDQSDNRFKIESNINNYYGLYNDENEFSGNPTAEVTPADITLTNVSKTGFTAEISATSGGGAKQVNFPLLNSLASGDDYFVSFDYTSTNTSNTVGVKPRTATFGSASSDVISATSSGLYNSTGDTTHHGFDVTTTATVLSFQTTAQNFTFTVSNLKVSRITRDGFVETWYDQSGNERHMRQADEDHQPRVVINGSQVVDPTGGRPAVGFGIQPDGTGGRLLRVTSNIPVATNNEHTQIVVASIDRDDTASVRFTGGGIDLFLSSGEKISSRFGNNVTGYQLPTLGIDETTLLGSVVTTGLTPTLHFNGDSHTGANHTGYSNVATATLFQILGENNTTGDPQNRYHLSGTMSEAILYLSDQTNNMPAIKANINNQYQLYT